MIAVWGQRNSVNVQKVMWTIGEWQLCNETGGNFHVKNAKQFSTPRIRRKHIRLARQRPVCACSVPDLWAGWL